MGNHQTFPSNPSPKVQKWVTIPGQTGAAACDNQQESYSWSELTDTDTQGIQNITEFRTEVDRIKEPLLKKRKLTLLMWILFIGGLVTFSFVSVHVSLVVLPIALLAGFGWLLYDFWQTQGKFDVDISRFLMEWSQKLPDGYQWMHQVGTFKKGRQQRRNSRLVFQVPLVNGQSPVQANNVGGGPSHNMSGPGNAMNYGYNGQPQGGYQGGVEMTANAGHYNPAYQQGGQNMNAGNQAGVAYQSNGQYQGVAYNSQGYPMSNQEGVPYNNQGGMSSENNSSGNQGGFAYQGGVSNPQGYPMNNQGGVPYNNQGGMSSENNPSGSYNMSPRNQAGVVYQDNGQGQGVAYNPQGYQTNSQGGNLGGNDPSGENTGYPSGSGGYQPQNNAGGSGAEATQYSAVDRGERN